MTFYRHFIERNDFKTEVATTSQAVWKYKLDYTPYCFSSPFLFRKFHKTRFLKYVSGVESLTGKFFLPGSIQIVAENFKPEIVFTVAGSWSWTALAAQKLADKLDVPLVASFNDWYNFGWFPAHPVFHKAIERRFRRFYREADLALCTSEGMREELGEHPNAHVWYPTGAAMPTEPDPYTPGPPRANKPFRVFFGGSLGEWYGPMMEQLVTYCREHYPQIEFRIFGGLENWSPEFDKWAKASGIFGGHIPFEQLREEAKAADLLLLPMGFDPSVAIVERTSFKTKFLDYLTYRRPILVWGPSYCSAVRVAQEFDSAERVMEASPGQCAKAIDALASDVERRKAVMANAMKMYNDRFHPDRIHTGLVEKINTLVENWQGRG